MTSFSIAEIIDPVTGLYNRHYMLHRLTYEAARSARYHVPLSCILFGIENFQPLTEELGQACADGMLVEIANIFRHSARVSDIVGRVGPDEFLMITPHTNAEGARVSAARIQRTISIHRFDLSEGHNRIGISVGLAGAPGPSLADNLALLGRAEAALARAREGEGNILVG